MKTCAACNTDQNTDPGCVEKEIVYTMEVLDAVRHGDETREGDIPLRDLGCSDCGAERGEFHHPGCDHEECPSCGAQLLTCNCSVLGHRIEDEEKPRFDQWGRQLLHGG